MGEVVANSRGYYGKLLRDPGDRFFVADGATASWFDPVGERQEAETQEAGGKASRGRPKKSPPEGPVRAPSEANELTGATEPDWVQPGATV